jgi:hypothetical protein
MDDVFAIWPHGHAALKDFLGCLNSIHPNIIFSMELEWGLQLPFLDVMVNQCLDISLGYAIYRKCTHIDTYRQPYTIHWLSRSPL